MPKIASLSAFVNYANEQINKKNSEISTAFKSDVNIIFLILDFVRNFNRLVIQKTKSLISIM